MNKIQREKISKSRTGKPSNFLGHTQTKQAKDKIGTKSLGRIKSEKVRKKISIGNLGQKRTEESRKNMGGKNHWNWKGGITEESQKCRNSFEYKIWDNAVFARDNFTCQKYGTRGGDLHAHHILNFSSYPDLRLDINNGITLSKKAHKEFHKKYGNKNNTMEQLLEFLNK